MIAAFFDIDRTIIWGTSMERVFFRYLLSKGYIKVWDVLKTGVFILCHLFDTSGLSLRARRPYLSGKPVNLMDTLAKRCFDEAILPLISEEAVAAVRFHKDTGHRVILLSATLEILAENLCRYLGVDAHITCQLERNGGYFTGKVIPPIPYGEGKREIMKTYAREYGIDLKDSFAYGDSLSDMCLFECIGNPIIVNPGRRLLAAAKKRGWKIQYWSASHHSSSGKDA